jgi:hypothetical protein
MGLKFGTAIGLLFFIDSQLAFYLLYTLRNCSYVTPVLCYMWRKDYLTDLSKPKLILMPGNGMEERPASPLVDLFASIVHVGVVYLT